MPGDELFGPDGTQALQSDLPLRDPLGGLVTGAAFASGDAAFAESPEERPHRVVVPGAPAAPDQAPLKLAVDKAMMTGPPTNPLRLPGINAPQQVRAAPTVAASGPVLAEPLTRRNLRRETTRRQVADEEQIRRAMRASLAGRQAQRRGVVSGLVRLVVGIAVVVVLLILVLHGSGSGGNLSGLFG